MNAPDVVGSARRTLELFEYWYPKIEQWPIGLVAQNGQEDLPIPWKLISAIFIGGDDDFKDSKSAMDIIKTAHAMDKHIHVGRVNGVWRVRNLIAFCAENGIEITVDGAGISKHSHMRVRFGRAARGEPIDQDEHLFSETEQAA